MYVPAILMGTVNFLAGKGFLADNTPWWNKYLDEFHRMVSFGELETFDHPVGCKGPCLHAQL